MALGREEILALDGARELKEVEVPEWGDTIWLRVLNGLELERVVEATTRNGKLGQWGPLLVQALCDREGRPLFQESEVELLMSRPGPALLRLAGEALELNGLKASLEDEVKNSKSPPTG